MVWLQVNDLVIAEVPAASLYSIAICLGDIADLRLVLRPHPSLRLQAPPHGRPGRGTAGHRHGALHDAPGQIRED